MWEQLKRVTKKNGAIVMTASQPFTTALIASNMKMFKYCWVWDKINRNTGFGNVSFMPLKRHEDILIFVQNGKPTFNKQMTDGKPYVATRTGKKAGVYADGGLNPQNGKSDGKRNPISIIGIKADNKKEAGLHPTQKPVALGRYLIRTYTNENDTVLDFTAGSGSFGVAAVLENRKFIGIELDEGYFEIMEKRIKKAKEEVELDENYWKIVRERLMKGKKNGT